MIQISARRLKKLQTIHLSKGNHDSLQAGACALELVSYLANEPWSDTPQCVCQTLREFVVSWNDGLPTDEDRDRLLKPFLPRLIGTKSTEEVAERRSYMALDWLIRVYTPKWLDLVPSLAEHALALRNLDEIVDIAGAIAAGEKVRLASTASAAAWDAAVDAARDAAVDAAWAAARDAAWAAARNVAWDAAGAAAGAAARNAAWGAAWDAAGGAAWAAAWAAARGAAGAALKPTTEWLQASAADLLTRMIEHRIDETRSTT